MGMRTNSKGLGLRRKDVLTTAYSILTVYDGLYLASSSNFEIKETWVPGIDLCRNSTQQFELCGCGEMAAGTGKSGNLVQM
jgi:hypothetical protein